MSHQPQRREKDCLNCGAEVHGRYCPRCGQENIVTHQNFLGLTKHFIYDIFHFDGKFFDTLQYLLFSPGRVPADYVRGRRNRYLDPIRMYLFTSALFFLIFFSTQKLQTNLVGDTSRYLSIPERFMEAARYYSPANNDSADQKRLALLLDTSVTLRIDRVVRDTAAHTVPRMLVKEELYTLHAEPVGVDIKVGDSNAKPGWVDKHLEQKWVQYKRQYNDDVDQMLADLSNRFFHWFPYILFVSLPLFAFILKLLYNRNKRFYYSDHAVFTLYHYIFSFLLLLLILGFNGLADVTYWGIFTWISNLLLLSWFIYLLFAMRRFYQKSWANTFGKFLLLNILGLLSFLVIFSVFIFAFILQL